MALPCPRQLCFRAQGSSEPVIPCGDRESRSRHSKSSIVSFTSAEFFWIFQGGEISVAFYGIQEANGFELLRLLRRKFSLLSCPLQPRGLLEVQKSARSSCGCIERWD